jgi:uncharacterized protein YnzC (UPF0291/DUF896 family)
MKTIKPKYTDYRICYEGGNSVTGKKIYELQKLCDCNGCRYRREYFRGIRNKATAITDDINRIDEVAEFLEGWYCENGNNSLKTTYFNFTNNKQTKVSV